MVTKEKVKEIPLKRPKGVGEDQWAKAKELYKIAKLKGDAFPELTVAQAALETDWFKKPSGKYNYFGQKASKSQKGSIKTTQEQVNDSAYYSQEKFRDYNNLEEAVSDRISKWGEKYKDASTAREALSKIWKYDENKGQGVGYATDTKYGEKIDTILNMIGIPSKQEKSLFVYTQEEQSMGPENPPENTDEKNLTNFAETQESSIFAKPSSSEEEDDEVDEVPDWKLALEKKQQERDVITDYISRGGLDFNAPEYERTVLPQPAQQKFEEGGQIPTNPNGVFAVGKNPVRVPTKDGNITMKGVEYPILGIANTGEEILMQPGGEYHFKGATEVLELPQLQKGGLKKADSKEKPNTQNTGRNTKNPSTLDLYNYNNFLNEEGTTDPAETGVKKATIKKNPTAFDLYNSKVKNKKDVVEEELRTSGPFRQFDVDNLEASSEENKIEPIEKTSEIYSKKSKELMKLKKDSKEIEKGAEGKYVGEYQRILKDQGLYTDEIDDKFGPNTRQAVKDYQKEKGMEVTGVIDQDTAAALIAEKEVEESSGAKENGNFLDKNGSKKEIKVLQRTLLEEGYDLGNYGSKRDGVDGIVGDKTLEAIDDYNAKNRFFVLEEDADIVKYQQNLEKQGLFKGIDNTTGFTDDSVFSVNESSTCSTEFCTAYVGQEITKAIGSGEDEDDDRGGRQSLDAYGDAWTFNERIVNSGGKELFSIFESEKPNLKGVEEIDSYLEARLESTPKIDWKKLRKGDTVNIYYPGSSFTEQAYREGTKYFTSHAGIIKEGKNGELFVEHNIGGTLSKQNLEKFANGEYKNNAGRNMRITAAVRPDYKDLKKKPKETTEKASEKDINTYTKKSNITTEESPLLKEGHITFAKTIDDNREELKSDIGIGDKEFTNLSKAIRAIGWKESYYNQDRDEASDNLRDMAGEVREFFGGTEKSRGITNIKDQKNLTETLRSKYIDGKGDNLEDPQESAIPSFYALASRYKYLKDLSKFENINVSGEELSKLAMLGWNEDISIVGESLQKYKSFDGTMEAYRGESGSHQYDIAFEAFDKYLK
jgi:peptidoglycan hydrolase-like protein with peptidoglycan-binding domain